MAWTVLRTVTDSVSYVTAADHNETKANFDIVGGADGATKTGNWYVSGNVGIGTTSPETELHVKGTGQWVQPIIDSTMSSAGGSSVVLRGDQNSWALSSRSSANGTTNNGFSIFETLSANLRFVIQTGGNVGIGTTSPGYLLTLASDSAAKPTSNTWTISSDARVKEVIGSYTRGVADIVALQPKRYRLNGAFGSVDDGRVHVSVIAQEAQATWPEMIGTYDHTDKDADDVETVTELLNLNTNELQWALVNAIKELAQRVEVLER